MNNARTARTQTIDSSRFRLWLQSREAFGNNASVGVSGSSSRCPAAEYLRQTRYHTDVSVLATVNYRTAKGRARSFPAPKWLKSFMLLVDAGTRGQNITASAALAALDKVKPVK